LSLGPALPRRALREHHRDPHLWRWRHRRRRRLQQRRPRGNIYIADLLASRLRRVDAVTGVIDTIAGSGTVAANAGSFTGEGVSALEARFNRVSDVEVNDAGDLFIADAGNRRIRKIDGVTGIISTIAGTGNSGQSGDDGPALAATFSDPVDLALGEDGSLVVNDSIGAMRLIQPDGRIVRLLGNGVSGQVVDGDGGPGDEARFGDLGCCFNGSGDIIVRDDVVIVAQAGFVRQVKRSSGVVVTVVGAVDPPRLGPVAHSRLPGATGVDVAALIDDVTDSDARVVFVAGDKSGRVFRRRPDDSVDVVFGSPTGCLSPVAAKHHALSGSVLALAVDDERGVLYVGGDDGVLRAVFFGDEGADGAADAWPVEVVSDQFDVIAGIAVNESGAVVVVDGGDHCVLRSGPAAALPFGPLLGRCGVAGATGDVGAALGTLLREPTGVAVADGAVFVADTGNNRVHRVFDGVSTVVLGDGSESNAGEGSPSRAFPVRAPKVLAVDAFGNLWVAADNVIRLLPDGAVSIADGEVRSLRVSQDDEQLRCLRGVSARGDDVIVADTCAGVTASLSATLDVETRP
jgi:hypothetical protein